MRAMHFRSSRLAVLLISVALLTSAAAGSARLSIDIQVDQAWIRWLPAGVQGAGYMNVTNTGSTIRTLIGAASPDYREISFHLSRNNNGMNEMSAVVSIELTPHVPVHFAEGGYHLMLMHPTRSIRPGDRVSITLRFADGQSIVVPFDVRAGNSA